MGGAITGQPWTDDELAELRRLRESGVTINECAAQLGRSKSAVSMRAIRLGLQRWKRPTGDIRARVLAAAELAGATLDSIATRAGVSTKTVQSVLTREFGAVPESISRAAIEAGRVKAWKKRRARLRPSAAPQQERALALLNTGPRTADELARELACELDTARALVYRLRAYGLVFGERVGARKNEGIKWHSVGHWLAHNSDLVYWCARRAMGTRRRSDLRDDAIEEAASELKLLAYVFAKSHRRDRGTKFSSYFAMWGPLQVRKRGIADLGGGFTGGKDHAPRCAHLSGLSTPDGDPLEFADPRPAAHDTAAATVADLLDRAAGLLAPAEERAVRAYYLEGLTDDEAAALAGVTGSAVQLARRRAVAKLRDRFNPEQTGAA